MTWTQWWEFVLNKAMQRNYINRGENAVCLSCLLPSHPPSLFEREDLVMMTNSDKWQNTRHFHIVLGLAVGSCHSDLPPRGTYIPLSFSLPPFPFAISSLAHIAVLVSVGNICHWGLFCYEKHVKGLIAPWIVYTGPFRIFITYNFWFL